MLKRIVYIVLFVILLPACDQALDNFVEVDGPAHIIPDYTGITIPYNIAPLNFFIDQEGDRYAAVISSSKGKDLAIRSKTPDIRIPIGKWKNLLSQNRGEDLKMEIFVKNKDGWVKYKSIHNTIAKESIHPYIAYRIINTQFAYSASMKFGQRSLESFDEDIIFDNKSTKRACFNCHSFSSYDPDKFSMHFRQSYGGTLIKDGEKLTKLNTKTPHTQSPFGYAAFNPDGELVAYSVNSFNEFYTNSTHNLNEVTDQSSDIVVYNIKTNVVTTSPKLSTSSRENFPSWSPDGRFLYYLSADEAFGDFDSRFFSYYSLVRIEYNKLENSWGEPDTIFHASKEAKSLTFPRVSPDGKYLLFCLIDYGYFSINHRESDLYLMDLETREYKKLDINSEVNESYHAWSQDGRWIVFSSKRYNELYSAPHFAYFDEAGNFHKPFILPQKDPLFYDTYLWNYNIPEFINGKVDLKPNQIRDILYSDGKDVAFDKEVDVEALIYTQRKKMEKDARGNPDKTGTTSIHN